tara:strand:+ start:2883 stop:3347 length:465 start_codon:yes stop_codon:yes gene_type:complete
MSAVETAFSAYNSAPEEWAKELHVNLKAPPKLTLRFSYRGMSYEGAIDLTKDDPAALVMVLAPLMVDELARRLSDIHDSAATVIVPQLLPGQGILIGTQTGLYKLTQSTAHAPCVYLEPGKITEVRNLDGTYVASIPDQSEEANESRIGTWQLP